MKRIFIAFLMFCTALSVVCGNGRQSVTTGGAKAPMEFVIGNGTEIQSIDPTQIEGVPEHKVNLALFEGLVGYDPKTNKAVPAVAESWTISADGSVITFKIRSGLTWSDGTPINAQTFVDSWLYHLNPTTASKYAYMAGMVIKGADLYNTQGGKPSDVGIRAVDAATFEVTLVGNVPYAVDMFAHQSFSPVPLHVVQKYGSDWIKKENFVGNGPFVLQEWIPNDRLVVIPNERYWNKEQVFLTKLTFLPIEDTNTAYQAFKNGEIDWSYNIPLALIDQLKLDKDYQVSTQLGSYFYYVNVNHPILKDVRIRKALSMSFDRQELIDRVVKGGQLPAFALCPPIGDYKPATGTGYNVAEAKRLLAEAGYPDGRGLPSFTIIYNTLDSHKVIAEYLQQVWKNTLGVNVTLQNLEWATFLEERKTSRMELGRAGWIADYADAQNFLDLLITNGGNNDGHYSDPEYDRLLRQASALPGGAQRDALLHQAEEIAVTRDQAIIPIYYYVSQNLIDLDKWDGWYTNPQDVHPWVGIKRK
ncbi:MAG: peptide ABC transporter substrate-binding protein [Spirochaetaceae bacterium]|jgi:oligopeptide transport system substrate-binding protein|nr:peptide ABC transporter substrate-binding protein [Spirochaetaceae bacterium]